MASSVQEMHTPFLQLGSGVLQRLCGRPRPSGNRSLKSPWPAPDTRRSRDKIQTGCSPCHSCSCSHSRSGFRPRCGGTGRRGSTRWCTPSHTCLGASGDNPKTGKRGRWGWGRHTPLFKEEERQWAVAPVAASVQAGLVWACTWSLHRPSELLSTSGQWAPVLSGSPSSTWCSPYLSDGFISCWASPIDPT